MINIDLARNDSKCEKTFGKVRISLGLMDMSDLSSLLSACSRCSYNVLSPVSYWESDGKVTFALHQVAISFFIYC